MIIDGAATKISHLQSQFTVVTTDKSYLQAQSEQLTRAQETLQDDYQSLNQLSSGFAKKTPSSCYHLPRVTARIRTFSPTASKIN
jgi:hypothetical protein